MPDRTVKCPRCGRMVDVPTTGEKVHCTCGQKFRFDPAPGDEGDGQAEAPLVLDLADENGGDAEPSVREVRCPRCGTMVDVPTTGEKVHCRECGQKFRFDRASDAGAEGSAPADAEPVGEGAGREVRCPRCGTLVDVPTTGEKVWCSECGQKFRFDAPPGPLAEGEAGEQLVLELEPPEEALTSEVQCPRCGEAVAVPTTGEKVRCPGCGQKFRFDAPPPPEAPPAELPSPGAAAAALPSIGAPEALPSIGPPVAGPGGTAVAEADELRELWPLLSQFVTHIFEEGEATEADRRLYRSQVDRAGELARRVLPSPDDVSREAYQILSAVLPETTLDEIVALSLEDFRHLRESLDEAQALLDRLLPKPAPELPTAAAAPRAEPRRPRAPGRMAAVAMGLAALLGIAFGAVVAVLVVRERLRTPEGETPRSWAEILGVQQPSTSGPRPPATSTVAVPRPFGPGTGRAPRIALPATRLDPVSPRTGTPVFVRPRPSTGTAVAPVGPPAEGPTRRVLSRWKPGADGWVALLDHRSLDGWLGTPERWNVRDGVLYGIMPLGSSALTAQEADWTDYTLALEVKLGNSGTLVLHHGPLAAMIGNRMARLGYPAERWRLLDEIDKGAARNRWYRVVLDTKGRQAEVSVDGKPVLSSAGHRPQPGAPAIEVQSGAVAVRSVRLRLHPTDPDYRAVALGEGWLVAVQPPEHPGAPTERTLPPGTHTLFNGANFAGWAQRGDWQVRGGLMVGRAPMGDVSIVSTGAGAWRDYAFKARCRLTRKSRIAREGEYFLVIVRYHDDHNFFCIRFAIEGIYELGYYHKGRWRETSRARHGLGTDFNKWRDVQVTVRGDQVSLAIDGIGGKPPWPIPRHFGRGAVALGVTGGEAVFDNVRVHLPR